jgi:hypothetical protein
VRGPSSATNVVSTAVCAVETTLVPPGGRDPTFDVRSAAYFSPATARDFNSSSSNEPPLAITENASR